MNRLLLPLILSVLLAATAGSLRAQTIADTPANRQQQAARYLAAAPPKEMMDEMMKKMVAQMPEAQRAQVMDVIAKRLDMNALMVAMSDSLVKHFTAEELKALADFYTSPVGKSAMSKMVDYSADLVTVVQAQMMKAPAGQPAPGH